jgi:hypothetical protein
MSFWNGHHWEGVDTHPIAGTSAKPEGRVKRLGAAALEATLITALTFGLIAGSAFAARGGGGGGGPKGGGGSSSLSVVVLDADGIANQGDSVTFAFTTSNAYPVISLTCAQGGSGVYSASGPMYQPNVWDFDGTFLLASLAWSSGAADCTAVLKGTSNGKMVTLGSTSFHVSA